MALSINYTFINSLNEWKNALSLCSYDINPDLFQIEYSFYNNSNTRKRKATQEFSERQEFHDQLNNIMKNFQNDLRAKNEFTEVDNNIDRKIKNIRAKAISKQYLENSNLIETCYKLLVTKDVDLRDKEFQYFHKFIENNETSNWETIEVFDNKYLLPPRSGFIMSDIKFANKFISSIKRKFDLIVIDPPVKNKSVKQSNAYGFLDEMELLELPVRQLVKENTVVAVWCTNSDKCMDSIESCLFRAWGIKLKAICSWLKVTKFGHPILDINDRFRRPYEKLFLGRVQADNTTKLNDKDSLCDLDEHVILSVPCSLHSAKPNLQNFLSKFLPENSECLELFARNLYPGWVSWGNEPLKFLRTDLMVQKQQIKPNCETL